MSFSLTTQSFTLGENTSESFVFSESYLPADPAQITYGRFFLTMAFPDFKDGELVSKKIMEIISATYYEDLSRPTFESFEQTLQELNRAIPELCKNAPVTDLDIVLCVSSGVDLHLSQSGKACLYLLRGNQLTHISEELSEEATTKVFQNISSGSVADKDIMVLSTGSVSKAMDEKQLIDALKKTDFQNIHNNLESLDFLGLQCLKFSEVAPIATEAPTESPEVYPSMEGDTPIERIDTRKKSPLQKVLDVITGGGRDSESQENDMIDLQGNAPTQYSENPQQPTKFSNTMDILKNNVSKNWEKLFNKRKGMLTNRNNRPLFVWVLIVVVILVVVGFWWNAKHKEDQLREQYAGILETAQEEYTTAQTKSIYDKEMAKNLLLQLKTDVQKVIDEAPDESLKIDAQKQMMEINELLDQVDYVYRINAPTIAYNLEDIRPNIQTLGFVAANDEIYVYDFNAVYKLLLDTVDYRKIEMGDDSQINVRAAAGFENRDALVFQTEDDRFIEFREDNFTEIDKPEEGWGYAVAIADYSNYLYFLDPLENEIWRYVRVNTGYDGPTRKNADQNISDGVDLAIDGAIYILTSTGQIIKSYANEPRDFSFKGLVTPLNNPTKLFADSNPDNGSLYILDQQNSRVVVTNKAGQYEAQYLFEGETDLVDMYVDETNRVLYVLTRNGRVYTVDLIS